MVNVQIVGKSCPTYRKSLRLSLLRNRRIKLGGGNIARVTAMTPPPKGTYVCKKCGYVLPKQDAMISGWDSERSSTHVHCPRCGKIITRYAEQKRRNRLELDRIDKVLFILPFSRWQTRCQPSSP